MYLCFRYLKTDFAMSLNNKQIVAVLPYLCFPHTPMELFTVQHTGAMTLTESSISLYSITSQSSFVPDRSICGAPSSPCGEGDKTPETQKATAAPLLGSLSTISVVSEEEKLQI